MRKAQALYTPLLDRALANDARCWAPPSAMLAVTAVVYTFIGKTFMPDMDEGDIIMQTAKLFSINLAQTANIDQRVQAAILNAVPK